MVSYPSITTEIEELLSITMPDNSEQPPTSSSPKRPTLMAPIVPIVSREEIPLEFPTSPRALLNTLPDNILHLQQEMNNAMSCILTLQALLDAQQWRLISDIETTLCQNEAKAAEVIKIVKACYAGTIHEAKAMYAMAIREVETNCSTSIMEMEGGHSTDVRDVEATCVAHALNLQQAHGEAIRTLKMRPSRRMGGLTNLCCGPAEWPSWPALQSP